MKELEERLSTLEESRNEMSRSYDVLQNNFGVIRQELTKLLKENEALRLQTAETYNRLRTYEKESRVFKEEDDGSGVGQLLFSEAAFSFHDDMSEKDEL